MNLPIIGTSEQTALSRFQVTLVDKTVKMRPLKYPRINRFFETIEDRNEFVRQLEASIIKVGGRMEHDKRLDHPLFISFNIVDAAGRTGYEVTVYH